MTASCPRSSAWDPAAEASASPISTRMRRQSARKRAAGLGQADEAGRAVQQGNADALLERGDGTGHGRRRHAEAPGGGREALGLGHRHEDAHGFEAVH